MEKWYIYLLILLIAGVAGCNDEDKLSATERPEFGISSHREMRTTMIGL